jgi:glycerophosphoryl diester phosphodiesterase
MPLMLPEIVCHRGANELAPENTYASSQICLDWGVDYVEIDVSTSADGVLYVIHGPELDRTTNGTGRIDDHTSEELNRLDAGSWFDPKFSEERLPRVDDFLTWIKGKAKVYFDVKAATHQAIVQMVERHGFEQDCFFWSGDNDWAIGLKAHAPHLPLKVNVNSLETFIQRHDHFGMDIIEIALGNVTETILDEARSRGVRTMIYHQENDENAFGQIIDWGVEMVNLNHADSFLRVREAKTG